jgi:hypothetical protein
VSNGGWVVAVSFPRAAGLRARCVFPCKAYHVVPWRAPADGAQREKSERTLSKNVALLDAAKALYRQEYRTPVGKHNSSLRGPVRALHPGHRTCLVWRGPAFACDFEDCSLF